MLGTAMSKRIVRILRAVETRIGQNSDTSDNGKKLPLASLHFSELDLRLTRR